MRELADETEIRPTRGGTAVRLVVYRSSGRVEIDRRPSTPSRNPTRCWPCTMSPPSSSTPSEAGSTWPSTVTVDLRAVDSAVGELGDPQMIVAMAMRKLQALNLLATPGVLTTTDVVVAIVQDLDRALVQAPNMHLKREAETTDWDAALAELEADAEEEDDGLPGPDVDDVDPEVERFREVARSLTRRARRGRRRQRW